MIVPSIDLVGGHTVQLIGGEEPAIDAGDPRPILERFARVGETAVVDVDAARGEGNNRELIEELCRMAPIRVGGGIRDIETARRWLDAGARRIIVGTAAEPGLLEQLPRDRVIVALDASHGEVVTHGWRSRTGRDLLGRVVELRDLCGGFLVTFVEREGRMAGTDLDLARKVCELSGDAKVTIAGGITSAEEIRLLDELGADAQVGMAIYTGELALAEGFTAPLTTDRPDGLWPTVVTDQGGTGLGLVYSNQRSVAEAITTGRGIYESRRRGLWEKGATSGSTQRLIRIDVDCDRDTLRFIVDQSGDGFCHSGTRTCWGMDTGLSELERRLISIRRERPAGSNTVRLFDDPALLGAKLREEAEELALAETPSEVVAEAADLLYFTLVKIAAAGVSADEIESELDRRARLVTRRPMTRKDA